MSPRITPQPAQDDVPAGPPRETYPIAEGPAVDHLEKMVVESHVKDETTTAPAADERAPVQES